MQTDRTIESRPPNWLPIPGVDERHFAPVQHVDENDLYSKGEVISFFPNQKFGYIKDTNGRSIKFFLDELEMTGQKKDLHQIIAGIRVGYDASLTSNGLHVSRLKIY